MKQFILQPGKICTIDPANIANQTELGIHRVIIIREVRTPLFSQRKFIVKPVDDDGNIVDDMEFETNECFLFPDGMCIIRYPSKMPMINQMDLDAVEVAHSLINSGLTFNQMGNDKRRLASICAERLSAIAEKFKYYMDVQEV